MPTSPSIIFPIPTKDKAILFKFYNENFPDSQWDQECWNEIFSGSDTDISIGLKLGTRYIGLILGEISEDNSSVIITALAIEHAFRRYGYGTILVEKFIEIIFTQTSVNKIILHFRSSKKNKLIKFYAELGFKNYHEVGHYSNGENKCYLELLKSKKLEKTPKG
jgi:ribosomal protein S18 acetylase RimI-like enzyme